MHSSIWSKCRFPFLCICFLSAVALCVAGFLLGKTVPFAAQWPLFEALRNTAAIIFAVVGAWMAIIYPERLRWSFGKDKEPEGKGTSSNIRLLLTPAVHSTAILVILLLVGLLAPLIKPLAFIQQNLETFRGVSYALLSALTCWQISIVILAMFPAATVQHAVDKETAQNSIDSARNRLRQTI